MIIWSGRGGLVVLLGLVFPFGLYALAQRTHLYDRFFFPFGLGLALAGVCCWILGRRWNCPPEEMETFGMDPELRPPKEPWARHTLYLIPMEYWGLVYVVIGLSFVAKAIVMGDSP